MDLISNLPKHILYEILSKLTVKESVRTSVLSKEWKDTWSTFPILDFSEKEFGVDLPPYYLNPQEMEERKRKRNNFINYVDRTLLRFHDQGLTIKQCKITMVSFDSLSYSGHMDHWIKLATESGVEVLEVDLGFVDPIDDIHPLPPCVLEAKSLIKLELTNCFRIDQAFLNHPIKFSSLRVLSLCSVYLGDEQGHEQVIQKLISSCPLIEYLTLEDCYAWKSTEGIVDSVLKSVSIRGLPKLKGVKALQIQEVDVDAPSLEEFAYEPSDMNAPFKANVDRCKNLRKLSLCSSSSTIITDQWFVELFSKFPLLESLKLYNCVMFERIQVSSVKLNFLNLTNCYSLNEINIDAANLNSFNYFGDVVTVPMISLMNSSSQSEVYFCLRIKSFQGFLRLRGLLQKFKPQNVPVSLDLSICEPTDEFNPNIFQEISTFPPCIKQLSIYDARQNGTSSVPLVTCLLWSCCPAIISLQFKWCHRRTFIKLLCEKLAVRKVDECVCNSSTLKCWWHNLKDVKIKISSWNNHENLDCKTFLDSWPALLEYEKVCLILEW